MSFAIQIITQAGLNLMANATAANPIVLVKGLVGDTAAIDAADLESKTKYWYVLEDGDPNAEIFSASATGTTCRIILSIRSQSANMPQPDVIKSACILAKLKNQSDSDAVIMAALSDADSQATIPSVDSTPIAIHIPFNITLDFGGQIEAVGSEYASESDLSRFVSLHKAGNPFEGETQNIRGEKVFKDGATFEAEIGCTSITASGQLEVADTSVFDGDLTVGGRFSVDGGISVGKYGLSSDENCLISAENYVADTREIYLSVSWPDSQYDRQVFYVQGDMELTKDAYFLGHFSVREDATFYKKLTVGVAGETGTTYLDVKDSASIQDECHIGGNTTIGGSLTVELDATFRQTVEADDITANTGEITTLTVENFYGPQPINHQSSLTIRCGALIYGWSGDLLNIQRDIEPGKSINIPANTVRACMWDSNLQASGYGGYTYTSLYIPKGQYVLIMGMKTSNGGTGGPILMVRADMDE